MFKIKLVSLLLENSAGRDAGIARTKPQVMLLLSIPLVITIFLLFLPPPLVTLLPVVIVIIVFAIILGLVIEARTASGIELFYY